MADTPPPAPSAPAQPAPNARPSIGDLLGSLGSKSKELTGAAQVATLVASIQADPAGYAQRASRDPEKFRTDMKLLADNIDNPLVQQGMSKGFLEAAKKMADMIPGGSLGAQAIETLAPRIEQFMKDSRFTDMIKAAAPMMDSLLKDSRVQDAMRQAPVAQIAQVARGVLPEGLSLSGMQDLNKTISGLTSAMQNNGLGSMLTGVINDFGSGRMPSQETITSSAKALVGGAADQTQDASKSR